MFSLSFRLKLKCYVLTMGVGVLGDTHLIYFKGYCRKVAYYLKVHVYPQPNKTGQQKQKTAIFLMWLVL